MRERGRACRLSRRLWALGALGLALPLLVGPLPIGLGQEEDELVQVIRAGQVIPVSGPPIENGMVIVRGTKIEAVGADLDVPEGATLIDLDTAVLTPGLIDARAVYGLTGGQNEESREVTPEVRAADAVDLHHPGFQRALKAGVTAAYLSPGTRGVISGTGVVVKTAGDDRWLREGAAIQATLGRDPTRGNRPTRSGRPRNFYYRRPTNRMGVTSVIRRALFEAGGEKNGKGLAAALQGKLPIRMTARHASDVKSALKFSANYGFPLIIEDGGEAFALAEEIAARNVPVVLRVNVNPHARWISEGGAVAVDSAARLHGAGVRLALATWADPGTAGPQDAAALAYRYGLPAFAALRAVTIEAASILGVADRIGSIDKGKDADLVAFDGDPLQVTSRVSFVMIDGRVRFLSPTRSAPGDVPEMSEVTPGTAPDTSMNK